MTFNEVTIGRVRQFWNLSPCNLNRSAAPIGSIEYFDDLEANKYTVEPHIPGFADFERWAGKRVLEIGCGLGCDTVNFCRAGADVTATDLSEVSLRLAFKRATLNGVHPRLVRANAEYLDAYLSPQTFDLIYSFGVIHHSPHPERIVEQAHKFCAPGGVLKVMVYHRHSWKVLGIVARRSYGQLWKTKQLVARHSEAQSGCPVTYTYTRKEAKQLIEQAGFRVTDMTVDHIFPYRIRQYRNHQLAKTWYWRLTPQPVFRWLERTFGWHLMVTAVKTDTP